ncbi:3764_t:CDS:2, partial [Diversispora eburnea]
WCIWADFYFGRSYNSSQSVTSETKMLGMYSLVVSGCVSESRHRVEKFTGTHPKNKEPTIIFYVIRKRIFPTGDKSFPTEINGLRTYIREGFYEPTVMSNVDCCEYKYVVSTGCSIGVGKNRIGTLGAFVQDSNKCIYLLSNNHVTRSKRNSNNQILIDQPAWARNKNLKVSKDIGKEFKYEIEGMAIIVE